MTGQTASLTWRDGTPVAQDFDDPYFSLQDGLEETRHVFLSGNDLPARFAPGFQVAELGFGTGLNLLATVAAHQASDAPGPLRFTSFEAFPMAPADAARSLAAFPEMSAIAAPLLDLWERLGDAPEVWPGIIVQVIPGDARLTLPAWDGRADAWFLDGFSPAKNPELWEPGLLTEVARHTATGGTFATYTAAGHVRRALSDAGFEVERRAGFGRKRHMSVGRKP